MNRWRLVFRSALHFWQTNFAVWLGVVAATAVLTGALLVGDSVRGSLRELALSRLGSIHQVILSQRFFRVSVAQQIEKQNPGTQAEPLIFMQGTLQTVREKPDDLSRLAGSVAIFGIEAPFWELGEVQSWNPSEIAEDEVVLNRPLAEELQVQTGDLVTLRLPSASNIPADSPLGKKSSETQNLPRLKVKAIIEAQGLGRFGLHPTQQLPMNAYIARSAIQDALEKDDKVNAIFIGQSNTAQPLDLSQVFLTLEDFEFSLNRIERTANLNDGEQTIFDWWQLTSSRMLFGDRTADLIATEFQDQVQPSFTYLATAIGKGKAPKEFKPDSIPYSTVTAMPFAQWSFPLKDLSGNRIENVADDEIVLNSWAAEDIGAEVDDEIYLMFFEPESSHGDVKEVGKSFQLAAITPITKPSSPYRRRIPAQFDEAPTTANDPDLIPEIKGLTDKESIDSWDPPFPYDNSRLRKASDNEGENEHEEYWDLYRTTPKAFITLPAGQKLWGSRFGAVTSFRFNAQTLTDKHELETRIEKVLNRHRSELGFQVLRIREDSLRAASGTTPFNVLFLGFSMFIIAAALMLVSLLFRLGLEQRSSQLGLLRAVGLPSNLTRRLLINEAATISLAGSFFGVLLGIGYAWLMIAGLRTWWLEAVVTPFLTLHLDNPITLLNGLLGGSIVCVLTIYVGMRGLGKLSIRSLLSGNRSDTQQLLGHRSPWSFYVGSGLIVLAIVLSIFATTFGGEAQAGAFFGSGSCVLAGILLLHWHRMKASGIGTAESFSLWKLSLSNASRNPVRSTLTIGLMASASFLIIAIGSFRLAPSDQGAGGMQLIAESSQPLFYNLNSTEGRESIGFSRDEETLLSQSTILSLRVQPGDDASCLNLYQSNNPRVLGIQPETVEYFDRPNVTHFEWAAWNKNRTNEENPWEVLGTVADGKENPIPCVLDKNTAMYAMHLYGGIGEEFATQNDDGTTTKYVVAGLLSNSIFQGNLLVSEANFLKSYPDANGYRMFLVQAPEDKVDEVSNVLESRLSDQGFDSTSTKKRLASLLAVQNTYLSTFQSLGGLGLLLGTFGLVAVQLRSILERRAEIALLKAAGFHNRRLQRLVMQESMFLLLDGLIVGILSAAVTVVPHMIFGDASLPITSLAGMLVVICIVGAVSGRIAVGSALKGDIVPALRGS